MNARADANLGSFGGAEGARAGGRAGSRDCCADLLCLLKGSGRLSRGACGQPGRALPAAITWGVLLHNTEGVQLHPPRLAGSLLYEFLRELTGLLR